MTTTERDLAKTMTCPDHIDGVIHYRRLYAEFECHRYIDRTLFTHVVQEGTR